MDDKMAAILAGSVEDAKGKLADLTREQLATLHDAEEKGAKRSTMLALLHSAIGARSDTDGSSETGERQQADTSASAKVYTQADWDKREDEHRDAVASMFDQAQVDAMLAERNTFHAAEKDRAVAEAKGGTAAIVTVDAGEPLVIHPAGDTPGLFATTKSSQIVFVDDQDRPIQSIPAMPFEPKDFEPNGGAVTLVREVEFPKELPIADVAGAFLIDDEGDPIGRATLVMPFSIGGGRNAKLAKSSLQFAA